MILASDSGIPILLYHSIDDTGSSISTPQHVFRQQMGYLYSSGYRSVSLLEALRRVKIPSTKRSQHERLFVITFDDGYQSVYTQALTVLERCSFKATVFLAAGMCGREIRWKYLRDVSPKFRMLTWDEVKLMSNRSMDFGAHTISHRCLTNLPLERARQEILQSKTLIEHYLGKSVDVFAYPFGKSNEQLKGLVRSAFQAACTTNLGVLRTTSDPHHLPRIRLLLPHVALCAVTQLCTAWDGICAAARQMGVRDASKS